MKEFDISTSVYFGENCLGRLDEISGKRVLIICDAFIEKSGVLDKITAHLGSCQVSVFSKTVPDPPVEVIAEGIQCLESCRAEVMIAVGGGSAIDAAKAIRELGHRMGVADIHECFAIPTTSGTGSEVTKFSVITDAARGVKYPLVHDSLQPMAAILDPELVSTMPPAITADTGMDALTHALESYISTDATDFTDALAEKAVTLLMRFLPLAYHDGGDLLAREKVHNAACLAGMAFNVTGLGICHSIAHTIGAKFHVSHGRSNAMVLPEVLLFNADLENREKTLCASKLQRMAKLIGLPYLDHRVAVTTLAKRIDGMKRSFGIPGNLKNLGIDPEEVMKHRDSMVEAALADVCTGTNPRAVTGEDIERILGRITPL